MEIGNELWTFTPETEFKTCPECGGSGKDNATLDWKCWLCGGSGEIKYDKANNKRNLRC